MTRIGQPDVEETDRVALEEPLQLVVDGHPVAVLMRTPGNDEELAAGFLWTEGIISSQEEIVRIDLEYLVETSLRIGRVPHFQDVIPQFQPCGDSTRIEFQ